MNYLMNEAELARVHNFAPFSLKTSLDQSTPEACKTFDVHYNLVTTDSGFRHILLFEKGTWFKAGPHGFLGIARYHPALSYYH